jgi:integrase/recombinase XerD
MSLRIYVRAKNDLGAWRYRGVDAGRGLKTSTLEAPFYVRPCFRGVQLWKTLDAQTYIAARKEADQLFAGYSAKSQGLTVAELDDPNRIPVERAVEDFLREAESTKKKKTVLGYKLNLKLFLETTKARYLDQITRKTLCEFRDALSERGFDARTQHNRLITVLSVLKSHNIKTDFRLAADLPRFETERAVPFEKDWLDKLFAAMDDEEKFRYRFFLGTGCREQEVTFAAWADIDFTNGEYHIRRKPDVGFTPKSHESRSVPLPTSLVKELKERRKAMPDARWIFLNDDGAPEKHFLRKLKRIAHRAGLNCGQCRATITKGKYGRREKVAVTCATDPVCEHVFLHRLRKTTATRWQASGVPLRDIQNFLGHKSLETTQVYLGATPAGQLRGKVNEAFGD